MASLLFIATVTAIAALGYLITPDTSPNINNQNLEIAVQKPGFSTDMLLIRKPIETPQAGFLRKLAFGVEPAYRELAISSYTIKGGYLYAKELTPYAPEQAAEHRFALAELLYPIAYPEKIAVANGKSTFTTIDGQAHTLTNEQLAQEVRQRSIVRRSFLLGTDRYGRDLLSRMVVGARVSLSVGIIAVAISLLIGVTLGAAAGYFRGWVDAVTMWFINVIWSVPTLLMVIAVTLVLGKGFWQIFIAVGLTMWVEVARIVRGQVLSIREKEYVDAARALGFTNWRIIWRHILPNVIGPIIVISAANFASAILVESGLSFLGVGIQPPTPSWGAMLKDSYAYIILDAAYLAFIPGIAIMLMVLAFTLLGDGLREAFDVSKGAPRE